MADEVKLPLKTFRFRIKDKTSGKRLDAWSARGQLRVESLQRRTTARPQTQSALAR
jgi:hypothetical protein